VELKTGDIDGGSMKTDLQLVGVRFSNFLLG